MEELLNKLIEKGWKPFDVDVKIKRAKCFHSVHFIVRWLVNFVLDGYAEATVPLRELVSKESWLWQFVCENKLIKRPRWEAPDDVRVWRYAETMGIVWSRCFGKRTPEFYIIESALKDESELESFILDHIKVE